MRQALIIIFLFSFCIAVEAQSTKYEFRGAWIATVANIDWPSKPGLPAIEQQQQFIHRIEQLKELGCNAVIVQVRPVCDAFYNSNIEPWSRYLTGRQGESPFPYYDPLIFMIEEAHKRNMEFHAWFNPYRALMNSEVNPNPPKHVTRTHPEWIISYAGKSYLDPGIPEAREYVLNVICDVVKRYDIDAVHLDDYFYPYRAPGKEFGDYRTYAKYGGNLSIGDWRRNNVSLFISQLNTSIKNIKPTMKLGISPFGVWRNKSQDPEGSDTRGGQTNYDDLYADVLLWMQKGWIDYLMPQLYWEHTHKAVPFTVLMPWWYGHCYKRHMYYGLGLYRMAESKKGPYTSEHELLWQLRDIREQCPNTGYCFYNSSSFDKIRPAFKDSLKYSHAKYPAFVPPMLWLDSVAPSAPNLKMELSASGATLKWEQNNPQKEPLRYVVYRFVNNEPINLDRNDKIISIQRGTDYNDPDAKKFRQTAYVVTALDRLWNESKPSNKVSSN